MHRNNDFAATILAEYEDQMVYYVLIQKCVYTSWFLV